jgi:hypothetical protein
MKKKLLLLSILAGLFFVCFRQKPPAWDKWQWLVGEWLGEGSGIPGQGSGSFSFRFDLDNNILVRKSHSEYPAERGKPLVVHDDLLIVYADAAGVPARAIYFDNEGHVIQYGLRCADREIVFTCEKTPGMPVFRLTYTRLDDDTVNTEFAVSQDGEKFSTYVAGKSRRVK